MLSFKQILESYEHKQPQIDSSDQKNYMFRQIINAKPCHHHQQRTMDYSSHSEQPANSEQSQQSLTLDEGYMPSSINTYGEDSEGSSWINSNYYDSHLKGLTEFEQEIYKKYESSLEIYKFQRAHEIADICMKTGRTVHEVGKQVLRDIHEQIRRILTNNYCSSPQFRNSHMATAMKKTKLQSTLNSPYSGNRQFKSNGHHNELKPSPPPKIVEFTLGNHNQQSNSNQRIESQSNKEQYGNVSEFLGGKLNGPMSKQIKNRVMGNNPHQLTN